MCGCESEEIVFASRSNLSRTSEFSERCRGRTLTATVRSSRVSRALYTSPIPPAPNGDSTSYGPNLLPGEMLISIANHKSQIANIHDLPHPARAQRRENLVRTEARAGGERHFSPRATLSSEN